MNTILSTVCFLSSLIVSALALGPDQPGKSVCIDIFFTTAVVSGSILLRQLLRGKK